MSVLIDTNVIARVGGGSQPQHVAATRAFAIISRQHAEVCVSSQNLFEFYVIATRPLESNGLGMAPQQALKRIDEIVGGCRVLFDSPEALASWRDLILRHSVVGKNAHDARLVATMLAHGISQILTFNGQDFKRFPTTTILDPAAISAPPAP